MLQSRQQALRAYCSNIYTVIEGKLSGFIFQHVAKLTGIRWETAIPKALKDIMNNPSQCLLDLAGTSPNFTDNKVKTMHVFLNGNTITCP